MRKMAWNSRERVLTAFEHKEPDRVPLFEGWIELAIIEALGGNAYDARIKLGLDCLPLGWHPIGKTQAYGNGIDEWGRIFRNGQYGGGVVKTQEDLEKYTVSVSHAKNWFTPEKVNQIKKKYKEYALFFAWHDCSLGLTYTSMGIENFFHSLYDQPELVKAVIERSTEWIIALVEQANHVEAIDFILLGDDAADNSRPLISPKFFRELILSQYKRITRASDIPIIWHSDGHIIPLLPMIVEAGFAGVHSLEPKANIDLTTVKKEYGDKLVLAGNLDTTEILCQANLELVRKEVKRCIRQGAPGGGYLFSSSNSLFEGHNIKAIIEAYKYAKKISNYPITF